MFRRRWHLLTLLLALGAFDQQVLAQQDPFSPSLRWTHAAPIAEPWIPESVFFGRDGEMVWASGNFGAPRLMLLASPGQVLGQVVREDVSVADSTAVLSATTQSGTGVVFSIAQYATPVSPLRSTEISRYDPLGASAGPGLSPTWTRTLSFDTNGPAKVVCDDKARVVVSAVYNSTVGRVQLDWIRSHNNTLVRSIEVPAAGISALEISLDGSRVLLCGGGNLYVFDTTTGVELHHEALAASTNAVTLSGDGRTFAYGSPAAMVVMRDAGSGYQANRMIPGGVNFLPTRADLSEDGNTLALGWWNAVTSAEIRYDVIDVPTSALLNTYTQVTPIGGLQNFPHVVVVTRDGSRTAFGGWGAGGPEAEVLLVERGVQAPILSVNLPGSVRSLDLDPSGTRVIVGSKNSHANQLGSTGELRLYESGEGDLVQLTPASSSVGFEFAARQPGASAVLFLVGVRAQTPSPLVGFGGAMALTRRLPIHIQFRPTDAAGRADASFPIPSDARWTGHSLSVQALFRINGGGQVLSERTVTPLIF